jgi:beta-1,2-mannobiose phosphorylase / 1,2-beta-oligomannan phosphorylase
MYTIRMSTVSPNVFDVRRLGVVMRPDPAREDEVEGVLNPAAARGRDGELYLFPRVVGRKNFSRIGIARVIFDGDIPVDVERLGYALEPQEPYELRPAEGTGGCEDARVTYVEPLDLYVMAYAAWGPTGPRLALAVSEDLLSWRRLGPIDFEPSPDPKYGVVFNEYHNKDGAFAPEPVWTSDGRQVLVMLHRPLYTTEEEAPKGVVDPRPSIWASGVEVGLAKQDLQNLLAMREHIMLVDPEHPWEHLRIGGGTPPIRTDLGFLLVYHGVSGELSKVPGERSMVNYTAGVLVFDTERSDVGYALRYRSSTPVLVPEVEEEKSGIVNNVVFPTGVDDRGNGVLDLYYGMADKYIGVARMRLPNTLPAA